MLDERDHRSDPDASGVIASFLTSLLEDRERGMHRDVAHYQSRFPGYETLIATEFANTDAATDEPGDEFAPDPERYQADGELGRGGMGVVYGAVEARLHRRLAIKQLRRGASPRELRRFIAEARTTAQLDHPGIPPVHELCFAADGRAWFSMPIVDGETFASKITRLHRDGTTDVRHDAFRDALDVLVRVSEAVAFAHSRGVVHRDLKPHNVMVGRFGEVYVMDWGLALTTDESAAGAADAGLHNGDPSADDLDDDDRLTMHGEVIGTPAYMAPEQAAGGAIDARTDVYAIGAMLYELLTGARPYADTTRPQSSQRVLQQLLQGPPRPVGDHTTGLPAELLAICDKAMQRLPARRYADAEALRVDLRNHLDGRVVSAFEHGRWAELRKWVRRNRTIAAAACVAVLALLGALAVSIAQGKRAQAAAARAEASLTDAADSVKAMLERVGNDRLDQIPQATPVRRELLADAVAFFERFLAEHPDHFEIRRHAARSNHQVAHVLDRLGEHAAAIAANARSLELWQLEHEREPNDPELRYLLASAHYQRAIILQHDDPDASRTSLTRASELLADLDHERASQWLLSLANNVESMLAIRAYAAKDTDQLEQHAQNALAIAQQLVERFGDEHAGSLGQPHNMLAGVHARRRDLAGTAHEFELAIAAYRRGIAAHPYDEGMRASRALALRNLAETRRSQRQLDDAAQAFDEAIAVGRDDHDDFPNIPAHGRRLVDALRRRSDLEPRGGDGDTRAITLLQEAATVAEQLAVTLDSDSDRTLVLDIRRRLFRRLRSTGSLRAAADSAQALDALPNATTAMQREASEQLAAIVADADANGDATLRSECTNHCIAIARRLVAASALSPTDLGTKAFDPVRDVPSFRELTGDSRGR